MIFSIFPRILTHFSNFLKNEQKIEKNSFKNFKILENSANLGNVIKNIQTIFGNFKMIFSIFPEF